MLERCCVVEGVVERLGEHVPLVLGQASDIEIVVIVGTTSGPGGARAVVIKIEGAKRSGRVVRQDPETNFPLGEVGVEVVKRISDANSAPHAVLPVEIGDIERQARGAVGDHAGIV